MRRRSTLLTLAFAAAFAVAGCGEDNGSDNDNEGAQPTPTRTAVAPTATQTPAPILTATPTGEVPTVTPTAGTPVPTATPGTTACEGAALTTTLLTLQGSDLDTGFSGIAFNQKALYDTETTANLDCDLANNLCVVDGAALVGTNLGGPLPLAAGGVPSCVINTFREPVTGSYNCTTGCAETQAKLTSFVYLSQKVEKPCPLCVGDTTSNDGAKEGTCDNDARAAGQPCDVNGISPTFGPTSNDCLPKGSSVGELLIDLAPLTTGTVTATASRNCLNPEFAPGTCFCEGQIQANSCTDKVCAESGICENGPLSGRCSNQTFRSCTPGTGENDCENVYPGSGTCEGFLNPCFGTTITRTGQCGTDEGVLVATFCVPATRAAAINTVAGLPGPGALTQPARQIREVR